MILTTVVTLGSCDGMGVVESEGCGDEEGQHGMQSFSKWQFLNYFAGETKI